MADWHNPQGPFDIPDVRNCIPRRLKPWLFIFFVLIIQFSGGIYLAAESYMTGTTGLMQEDILMAGYAMLIGMSINFAVMFRLKFRFSGRTALLICGAVLIAANLICASTRSVPLLVATCLVAGWFRMWATLICNSTIQLWMTPTRDMSVFFCYVYLLVDGVIQLSGIFTVYTAFSIQWEYMHWTMIGLLALMMVMTLALLRPVRNAMYIPLLGIDWIGAVLWSAFMLCFAFICVYGNFYDWWEADEIIGATIIGVACAGVNLWRATFLHHPYISFTALTNRNVIKATVIYLVFFTLMAAEHVIEHGYIHTILGFDETNAIDLNLYVLAGTVAGCAVTYYGFALRRWRYKTMTVIGFSLATAYLAHFYFMADYGIEKEALFLPLFCRGAAAVIISIVYLTSIVQGGMHFFVFPQALTVNGFTGAVMGATLGPAIIGEFLHHTMAKNASLISSVMTDTNPITARLPLHQLYNMVQTQAFAVSVKEIYGWLLIAAVVSTLVLLVSYGPVRPGAFMIKWRSMRKVLRRMVIQELTGRQVVSNG